MVCFKKKGQTRYLVSYTVAMQPLVSSVTLVSVWSPALMVTLSCTFTDTSVRTDTGKRVSTFSPPTRHTNLPAYFSFCFRAQQEGLERRRACQTMPRRAEPSQDSPQWRTFLQRIGNLLSYSLQLQRPFDEYGNIPVPQSYI